MSDFDRLNDLCDQTTDERDPEKLIALGREINKLLQGKRMKVIFEPTAAEKQMPKNQAA